MSNFQAVKESIFLGGCDSVRLRYLGENFVLLSCEGESSKETKSG